VAEKVGVLGGTFDPVHVGHIVAAVDTRHALALDRVLFVVAGDPWQKRGRVVASPADRVALVRAAVEPVDGLEVSTVEIDRGGPSVTADTLEALARPDRELFLLLGADAAANMPTWRRLEETRELCTLVIVTRAGERAVPPARDWDVRHVTIPRLDISSSDLRERLWKGRPIDGLVPPAVVHEIHERRLYTPADRDRDG
jgi:nicotinate-nucleotide adenylyltransferase